MQDPDLRDPRNATSGDLGASLPLSPRLYPLLQALRVQDNTVPSHTPLLDVRPRGRNQDKPVLYCVASCINIWDVETRNIYLLGSGPLGQDTDTVKRDKTILPVVLFKALPLVLFRGSIFDHAL